MQKNKKNEKKYFKHPKAVIPNTSPQPLAHIRLVKNRIIKLK